MMGHIEGEATQVEFQLGQVQGVSQESFLFYLSPKGQREQVHATAVREHERTRVHLEVYAALPICPSLCS